MITVLTVFGLISALASVALVAACALSARPPVETPQPIGVRSSACREAGDLVEF
jgi:hypothetical protein